MELVSHMELLDHAHTSGHLELDTQLEVAWLLVARVIVAIVVMHHSHQLKSEITTSVTELMDLTLFRLGKAVQTTIHASRSTTLHISVYSSLLQPLTGLSYESASINYYMMRLCWCYLLKYMCSSVVTFLQLAMPELTKPSE